MGFIRFLPLRTSTTPTRYNPWSTGNATGGTENGARCWVPVATTVGSGSVRCTTGLMGTQRYDVEFENALTLTGTTLQLTSATGGGNVVSGTFGASLIAVSDISNTSAQRHLISGVKQNTPPNQDVRVCWEYTIPTEDDLSWYGFGDDSSAMTIAATNRFTAFEWSGTATASTTTESVAQIPWPATGSFRRAFVRMICTSDVTLVLRKNGIDTAMSLAISAGSPSSQTSTAVVSVTTGDLLSWRFARTSGAATTVQWYAIFGFAGTS